MKIFTEEFLKSIKKILTDAIRIHTVKDLCKKLNLTTPEIVLMAISSEEFQLMCPCKIQGGYDKIENVEVMPLQIYALLNAIGEFENTGNIMFLKEQLDAYKASYACLFLEKALLYAGYSFTGRERIFFALGEVCYGENNQNI